ncbi:MAG: IS3 family transposase [Egibacteraceae bacterium]
MAEIRRVHADSDGTYGSPRVTRQLTRDGRKVNHKRVERLMRACPRHRRVPAPQTTLVDPPGRAGAACSGPGRTAVRP